MKLKVYQNRIISEKDEKWVRRDRNGRPLVKVGREISKVEKRRG